MYDKFKFREDRVFNVDETGISTVQKPCKRLGPKGIKQFGAKTSGERGKTVTVICCVNASGNCYVPPMFIFPRIRMASTLTKNGPCNAIYSCSKTGWSNEECFYQWLEHFQKTVKSSKDDPVLLVLDNHSSHISLPIFDFCKKHAIVLLTIPPHTSHKLQPLDISFYGPLKSAFNRQCDYHLMTTERILQHDLAEIFNRAYTLVATMDKAQSGFRASGVWPYQPDKFTDNDFLPASYYLPVVFDEDQPSSSAVEKPSEVLEVSSNKENKLNAFNTTNAVPTTSSSRVLVELSPLPKPPQKKKHNRGKQKSAILTDTPNRERLKEAAEKRSERKRLLEERQKKTQNKSGKPKKNTKKKLFDESESEDISESELCDDELSDIQSDENDVCLICGDTSKKDEMWYQCMICLKWAHALCSGADSPEGYVCDLCDP